MSSPSPQSDTLLVAIERAESHDTLLDDQTEVDDAAIFKWLKAHELHRGRYNNLVIGRESLPPSWKRLSFSTPADATRILSGMARDPTAVRALRALGRELYQTTTPKSDAILLQRIASSLASGALWAIDAKAKTSRFAGKTTPSVFSPLNARYGSKIDFAFIASLEGDQRLRGYVPISSKTNTVIGNSGMTVASGFDLGQWSERQLSDFKFPADLTRKLKPFVENPFKGLTRGQVAQQVATLGKVPELTKDEADLCDGVVFDRILHDAIAAWNSDRKHNVPVFAALPAGWQTVWLSRNYQEGGSTRVPEGKVFRKAALEGHWKDAIAAMKSYTTYKSRISRESALLQHAIPGAQTTSNKAEPISAPSPSVSSVMP